MDAEIFVDPDGFTTDVYLKFNVTGTTTGQKAIILDLAKKYKAPITVCPLGVGVAFSDSPEFTFCPAHCRQSIGNNTPQEGKVLSWIPKICGASRQH